MIGYPQVMSEITELIKLRNQEKLLELVEELQPYDLTLIMEKVSLKDRQYLDSLFSDRLMAQILQEMEYDFQEQVIKEIGLKRAGNILNLMSADDAADLLGNINKSDRAKLFAMMDNREESNIKQLLLYPPHSAGSLMTTEYIIVEQGLTVAALLETMRIKAGQAETVNYIYVGDEQGRLVGVLSLRELIMANPDEYLDTVINTKIIAVPPELDQEEVARIIEKYDFLAVPVISPEGKILGIVTVDDIIDVLTDEATEDIARLSGISGETSRVDDLDVNPFRAAGKRLPWLMFLLIIGMISGNIIAHFEETLKAVAVLAVFIPMIADMAGNTGTQSLAVVVRGLALGEFGKGQVWSLVKREAGVGLIIGTVNGGTIAILATLWQRNPFLGFVIGISLWVTLIFATLAGAIIPLILNKLKIDPAVASGPFITTINDFLGLTIYFTVATSFMQQLI